MVLWSNSVFLDGESICLWVQTSDNPSFGSPFIKRNEKVLYLWVVFPRSEENGNTCIAETYEDWDEFLIIN